MVDVSCPALRRTARWLGINAAALLLATHAAATESDSRIVSFFVGEYNAHSLSVDVIYEYDGRRGDNVYLGAVADPALVWSIVNRDRPSPPGPVREGTHRTTIVVERAADKPFEHSTTDLTVFMYEPRQGPLVAKRFGYTHFWAALDAPQQAGDAQQAYLDRLMQKAVALIDSIEHLGDRRLETARQYLDQIISIEPDHVQAYVELARVHMKNDPTTERAPDAEGPRLAEQALDIALEIDPDNTNALILMGYVYTIQDRHAQAEPLFARAEALGTENLWLYANWGMMLTRAGRKEEAIARYEAGVAYPVDYSREDLKSTNNALPWIYYRLLRLLDERGDVGRMDQVYAKRQKTMTWSCYNAEYARFKLERRGDHESAITLAKDATGRGCAKKARPILARAYYMRWAQLPEDGTGAAQQALRRARALAPVSPRLLAELAASPHAEPVVRRLAAHGTDLDRRDHDGYPALGIAVLERSRDAAALLLELGASPDARISEREVTALMLSAAIGDEDIALLLLEHGADPGAVSVDGYTAAQIARERGMSGLARLLSGGA